MDSVISSLEHNPGYLSAGQQIRINEHVVKEISSQRYPSIKINTGYEYSYSEYYSGLTGMKQQYGPYAGITLQIPIYNGNEYRIQKKTAQVEVENATLQQERLLNSLKCDAYKTYQSYMTSLHQIESQKSNFDLAKKLVDITLLNFQMNQATILEVKTAQTTFEEAAYLLVNLQYSAKIAEIELKRMIYQLKY
jgi:outer membrane protein TolC